MFTWNENETDDLWRNACFENVEECIEDAKLKGFEGNTIYVGETIEYGKACVNAEDVIDELKEAACDDYGECAESWLESVNREDIDNLSKRLSEVMNEWLKEVKEEPYFYKITNIQEVEIK